MAFVDLSAMRDPYFEVRIGPPGAQPSQMVVLDPRVHALIHSFEYTETRDGGQGSASRITLTFLEDLNKPGSVLDLVFDKGGFVRFVAPNEIASGKQQQKVIEKSEFEQGKDVTSATKSDDLKRAEDERINELKRRQVQLAPKFILQERNTVEVTWGYRTQNSGTPGFDKLTPRTVRGEVLQITHRATEGDVASTELVAVDVGSGELSKIMAKEGVNFSVGRTKALLASVGKSLNETAKRLDTAPARIDDIVRAIAFAVVKNADVDIHLTDEEKTLDLQDPESSRSWAKSTNLHTFLKEQAEKLHAHYFVTSENRGGKVITIFHFVSRRRHEGSNKFHFVWKSGLGGDPSESKGQSSLAFNTILNYNLALYPQGGDGAGTSGVCTETKKVVGSVATTSAKFRANLGEKVGEVKIQTPINSDPATAANANGVGVSTYHPACEPSQHIAEADRIAGRMDRSLRLDLKTIGIPQLTPTVVKVSNIGVRYSGMYYLLSVTHKIDGADGYTCSCVGESNVVASGGTSVAGPPVRNDLAEKRLIDFRAEEGETPKNLEIPRG